ncbi:MAG: hypothetical protein MUC69_08870 [Gemmatimonadales bacterium]|nr:hypothetical protein [Gemmatimonadales bacterium]
MRPFAFLLLLAAAPLAAQTAAAPAATPAAPPSAEFMPLGRQLTGWLLSGQADSILAHMTPDVREKVGGREGILKMTSMIAMRAGEEAQLVEEKMTRRKGSPQYWRSAMFSNMAEEPLVIRWVFDEQRNVIGAGVNPLSAAPAAD